MLGDRIVVLHLNDNDTLTDQHKIPMTCTIDWKDTFAALAEIGYDGIYNFAHRMNRIEKDARYADVIEKELYNGTQ